MNPDTGKTELAPAAAGVTCVESAPCARYVLRADPSTLAEVAAIRGWPSPDHLLRARSEFGRTTLWLGPDEWLLLGTAPLESGASPASVAAAHSWVDVSDRQVGLGISGPGAVDLLASECPLDLSIGAFAVDMCTRTIFGRCEIVLWRSGPEHFRLECWRSFLPYVQGLLQHAL